MAVAAGLSKIKSRRLYRFGSAPDKKGPEKRSGAQGVGLGRARPPPRVAKVLSPQSGVCTAGIAAATTIPTESGRREQGHLQVGGYVPTEGEGAR